MDNLRGLPWLVGGDFNEICYNSEKIDGHPKAESQMFEFTETLDACSLQDLHCGGEFFTWNNRRLGANFTATFEWRMMYPTARIQSLEFFHSDHRPIVLELRGRNRVNKGYILTDQKRFTFEHMWVLDDDCAKMVELGWNKAPRDASLHNRIRVCGEFLKEWAADKFGSSPKRIKDERKILNEMKTADRWRDSELRIREKKALVEKLSDQEEIYWKQRSRSSWLKWGDKNSKFFHAQAAQRKSRNTIQGLITAHGDLATTSTAMEEVILDYFGTLFTTTHPSICDIEIALNDVEPKVTQSMNSALCAPFSAEEVKKALFQLHPDKAPGPDGMTKLFFQKFWNITGQDITNAVLQVLNYGESLVDWNSTIVTLIPKVANPVMIKEFRPISLCNIIYKIVARAITNRLRPILQSCVDDFQSAFIPNRLISDNVILGFEYVHWMRNHRQGKCGYAALKLDMSKAYNIVEWNFLEAIILKLGFAHTWITKIMNCVSSVKYSFKLNQEVFGDLRPQRGIRQGDPLSPYLFVICAQGLSSLLTKMQAKNEFRGVRVANSCPRISHLFCADCSIIF